MRVCVISIYSFPIGMAPTTRIKAYTKSLLLHDVSVDIIIPFPTDNKKSNEEVLENAGKSEGINFYYASGRYKSRSKIFRAISTFLGFRKIIGYIKSYIRLKKLNFQQKFDFVFISNDSLVGLFIFTHICKMLKIKTIFVFDEFPTPIRHRLKEKIPQWKEKLFSFVLREINGYISISKKLSDYYCSIVSKPSLIIPIVVDQKRFQDSNRKVNSNLSSDYICYMGNLELSKDNVDNIIRAFYEVRKVNPSIELHIYGKPSERDLATLNSLIHELQLTESVQLKGIIPDYMVPAILKSSKILVSSQPKTVRASGGFPTKMGEYLLSGRPSIFCQVGENNTIVKDNEHLFFVEPEDPMAFARKILYILNNYDFALKIAENGREMIVKNYSAEATGLIILNYLQAL